MSLLEMPTETGSADETGASNDLRERADRYRDAVVALTNVCKAAAAGDLEPRVPVLGDEPELVAARNALNEVLDRTDAYVRESSASLEFASEAKFYRRFLVRGMLGSFRAGAGTINSAIDAMSETHGELAHEAARRLELADAFEEAVLGLSDQVASASTQMEASSRGLASNAEDTATRAGQVAESSQTASSAVTVAATAVEELTITVRSIEEQATVSNHAGEAAVQEAEQVQALVGGLDTASQSIGDIVRLIGQVASQTRLLALNATIEAARAGDLGKGFAVVASEVKTLAAETADATEKIEEQVQAMQSATGAVVEAIDKISGTVRGMGDNIGTIATAVGEQRKTTAELSETTMRAATAVTEVTDEIGAIGSATEATSSGAVQMTSASLELSRLAADLRGQVADFLAQIR